MIEKITEMKGEKSVSLTQRFNALQFYIYRLVS